MKPIISQEECSLNSSLIYLFIDWIKWQTLFEVESDSLYTHFELYKFVLETTELGHPVWDSNAYVSMFLEIGQKLIYSSILIGILVAPSEIAILEHDRLAELQIWFLYLVYILQSWNSNLTLFPCKDMNVNIIYLDILF